MERKGRGSGDVEVPREVFGDAAVGAGQGRARLAVPEEGVSPMFRHALPAFAPGAARRPAWPVVPLARPLVVAELGHGRRLP